jgi:hypothetical protein
MANCLLRFARMEKPCPNKSGTGCTVSVDL